MGTHGQLGRREPVPVGPGRAAQGPNLSLPPGADVVREFPLQLSKVQRPPLRREILRRDRLLDWLKVKIHNRVVLVTAEAGYGKTTLLADFARHHRRPTLWYRLDREDRDWVGFVHYLIAACREIEPGFGTATKGLLAELGIGAGPPQDTIFATFLRDLGSLGTGGAALIIDDYHLVDDVPDIRDLMRELVARGPERLTLVLVSRRHPSLQLARLRTLGEVAELTADDLRFDLGETERLFRDTYGRPLEADVLVDLADRTEGWAASLEMVNAAMRDRPPAELRSFVRGLSGAHDELYDYLAEEVVGELPPEMQRFLMTSALLQVVEPELAVLVSGFELARCRERIAEAEQLGLLPGSRSARRGGRRYHPLVREFLEARLRRTLGDAVASDLHRAVARHAAATDWRLAAHHFSAAGDRDDLRALIRAAVPTIMGAGEFALAASYFPVPEPDPAYQLFASRLALQRGQVDAALTHAESAVDLALHTGDQELCDYSLANLVTQQFFSGHLERAREIAETLEKRTRSAVLGPIASAVTALMDASMTGSLDGLRGQLISMATEQRAMGLSHYEGISLLNVAEVDRTRGDVASARDAATRSVKLLGDASAGPELESARTSLAWALALGLEWGLAEEEVARAQETPFDVVRGEVLVEHAQLHIMLGDRLVAESLLNRAITAPVVPEVIHDLVRLSRAELALRGHDYAAARMQLRSLDISRPHPSMAFLARAKFVAACCAVAIEAPSAGREAAGAMHLAAAQGARPLAAASRVLLGFVDHPGLIDDGVLEECRRFPWAISMLAEGLAPRLAWLEEAGFALVLEEARSRPLRWREPLRNVLGLDDPETRLRAGRILDQIGQPRDVTALRRLARSLRGRGGGTDLGRGLARRLARRVVVIDQGRVQVRIGDDLVDGADIRRKVLALLCFLLTRPQLSATRDQVLDALWPDLEPGVAANSLNQTVYFLRRVFEPQFDDEVSPGYVHHDSDVLWLDQELVTSSSTGAREAIRKAQTDPTPDNVEEVSRTYGGRFALDFSYEDWAMPYRESLHAAYLEIIERAVATDTSAGQFDRAIGLARRAVEIDPEAETIELSLLKLYRRTGAHAAAAEQYAHYAAMLRNDLGIEPPPLEQL